MNHLADKATKALLFLGFLAVLFVVLKPSLTHEAGISPVRGGQTFGFPGVLGTTDRRTLVVAVRQGCPYCTASASFYRDLAAADSAGQFHISAIAPGSVSSTRQYLASLGVEIRDVHQANLASLGIEGTPTLVLLDEKGRVLSTWAGRLSPENEQNVFQALSVRRSPSTQSTHHTVEPGNHMTKRAAREQAVLHDAAS